MEGCGSLSDKLLLCHETETCLDEEDEDALVHLTTCIVSDIQDDDEYLQMSLLKEKSQPSLLTIEECIRCARLDAVAWILRTRAIFGFGFQTAYLSVIFFDEFLSRRSIDRGKDWAIRLLSVACLFLAAKMEECIVPPLSEFFPAEAEDYKFENEVIQRMELLVLSTLEWKMRLVTPFTYIDCFMAKFCKNQSPSRLLISRTVQIIVAIMKDLDLMSSPPSVIAGAAILVALDKELTRPDLELKINSLFPIGFFIIEDVFSCYIRMKELHMENVSIQKHTLSPNLSPVSWRGVDSFENSGIISTKRKRLTFSDTDRNYNTPDKKRPR